MLLKDKVAIITGSASLKGIGWATAKRFADEGATVALLDIMHQGGQKAARTLEDENAKLKRIVADLSLDKAMLQDVLSKSSEACAQTRTRGQAAG